jgi:hypothetical protein
VLSSHCRQDKHIIACHELRRLCHRGSSAPLGGGKVGSTIRQFQWAVLTHTTPRRLTVRGLQVGNETCRPPRQSEDAKSRANRSALHSASLQLTRLSGLAGLNASDLHLVHGAKWASLQPGGWHSRDGQRTQCFLLPRDQATAWPTQRSGLTSNGRASYLAFGVSFCCLRTFFTIFCSSTRKARIILVVQTHVSQGDCRGCQ